MGTETIPKSEEALGAESPSNLELQIIRQIEYYFGNYNLSKDKFLKEQLKLDDGWIPLETMIKFNRLKKLSSDFNVITEALKKSSRQLMEISEDCTKIRRRTEAPLPEDYRARQSELDEKTLYVKGFKKNNSLDELLDFFKEHCVEHVFMRRNMQQNGKPFKGSVFVTFEERVNAEKFLDSKGIKYKGTELLKEWKKDYVKRKDDYYKNLRAEKEKKMLKKAGIVQKDETGDAANAEDGEKNSIPDIKEEQVLKNMIPGCLLKLSILNGESSRENIKAAFEPYGNLVYVDYSIGNPTAVIRFDSGIASSVLEKLDEEEGEKNILIGCKAKVSAIEGDEEKDYWKEISKSRLLYRQKHSRLNKNFGNKGRFRKGKRQKNKDDQNEMDDESVEPPKKRAKASEESGQLSSDKKNDSEAINVKTEVPEVKMES